MYCCDASSTFRAGPLLRQSPRRAIALLMGVLFVMLTAHGSWNRRPHSGYKVIFVPFAGGKPSGAAPIDVLTGFLSEDGKAFGRPVGVVLDKQGALLVADDVGNVIWRVQSAAPAR
jgi:glucose/arabinose dehydrogenase